MLAIVLALAASVCWGSGDFLGGLTTRRASLWAVVIGSQAVGLIGAGTVVVALGRPWPGLGAVWPVLVGGAAGAIAISTFYRALAIGTMSVIAPISAMSALIPFAVGLSGGERPSVAALAGAAVAVFGVLLVAAEPARRDETVGAPGLPGGPAVEPEVARSDAPHAERRGADAPPLSGAHAPRPAARAVAARPSRRLQRQAIGLALLAAVGIGLTLLGYDAASKYDPIWAMAAGRASTATFITLFLLARRPRVRFTAAAWPGIVAIGLMDTGANGLFAVATTKGFLSIVAVLGTIYPAVTVILAYVFLRERLALHQLAGVLVTLAGVSLIAVG
jgi:drug/metabolite transporter (DMT)-like permease